MTDNADLGEALQRDQLTPGATKAEGDENQDADDQTDERDKSNAEDGQTGKDDEQDGHETGDEQPDAETESGKEKQPDPEEQRKELQERLLEQEKPLSEARAALKQDWEDLEQSHNFVLAQFKKPVPLNGQPAYMTSDEEFEAAETAILDLPEDYRTEDGQTKAGFMRLLSQARKERREYLKKTEGMVPQFLKMKEERTKRTLADIEEIKKAYKEITPEYEKEFDAIEAALIKKFEANPLMMERFIWSGIRDKFRFTDRLLEETGIKQRVEKEVTAKTRPNLAATVGAGKGKHSTPAGSSKRIFTRAEIKAMNPAQYEKMEREIDKALMEGRIK